MIRALSRSLPLHAAACALFLVGGASVAPPQELVSKDRLLDTIRALPAKRAPLAGDEHREGLRKTEDWLIEQLKGMGLEPRTQEFRWSLPLRPAAGDTGTKTDDEQIKERTWRNIWVDLPGSDKPDEVLLISGHFDAVPQSPGADDDASGTAGVLELARVLKDQPRRRTLRLMFFNLEESGLVGSTRYVAEVLKPNSGERIVGMASLEMIGYFSDEPNSQKSPIPRVEGVFDPPTVGDSIAVVGIARHQPLSRRFVQEMAAAEPRLKITVADFLPVPVPDMMRSDHRPFVMAGLPGIMITDTANFRNPHYHKPTDTLDTLDAERMTWVVRAVAGAANALANAQDWPPPPTPEPAAPTPPAAPASP